MWGTSGGQVGDILCVFFFFWRGGLVFQGWWYFYIFLEIDKKNSLNGFFKFRFYFKRLLPHYSLMVEPLYLVREYWLDGGRFPSFQILTAIPCTCGTRSIQFFTIQILTL